MPVRGIKKTATICDKERGTIHLSENESSVGEEYGEENLTPHKTGRAASGPTERSINQVTLLGRVGGEPQQRGRQEAPVTVFSLATNSTWKNPNPLPHESEWTTRTDWHNIAVFKPKLREQAYNYIVKGCRVHITGRIVYGELTDKQGVRRHTTTIAAEDIVYLSRPQ